MIINNKLDQSFGPVGTSAGLFLFIAGIAVTFFSLTGLILVVIGAFIGFTNSSTLINFDQKKVKFSNNLFEIIPTGRWIAVDDSMKIGIKRTHKSWRAYSRSNRTLDTSSKDYRIILFDKKGKEIMPIKKYSTFESAETDLVQLSNQLELSII